MADDRIRAGAMRQPVPDLEDTPLTAPRPLADAQVAIVTTAALRRGGDPPFVGRDPSFRVLGAPFDELVLGHGSPNFDRAGWLVDPNVILPADRLEELAAAGTIGSAASRHLAFAGNQDETMTSLRLDSGPAAAELLRRDGVDVVLLTGV